MADAGDLRRAFLEELAKGNLQSRTLLQDVRSRLRGTGILDAAILTAFSDLFRIGYVAWGHDILNCDPPFMHVTDAGREALRHFSRDPWNIDGYLADIRSRVNLYPIAESYLEEALRTFSADCYKASAVMVGAASETLVLLTRDELTAKITSYGRPVPNKLSDWRVLTVLKAIDVQLQPHLNLMPRSLGESYDSLWPAFTFVIRRIRNDAGHPASIDPVSQADVHAALLIYPELAVLADQLTAWIRASLP